MNRREAAKQLGITDRTLGNWANEPDFPPQARTGRSWNVDVISVWRDSRGRKGAEDGDELKAVRLQREKAKLAAEVRQAKILELKLKKLEGEVVPRAAVELFAASILTELADLFDQFPELTGRHSCTKCRPRLIKQIRKDLDRIRGDMRGRLEESSKELDGGIE